MSQTEQNKQQMEERVSIISTDDIPNTNEKFQPLSDDKRDAQTILFPYQAALITLTNTFFAVFMKCFPAFIAFVLDDYDFTYSFVTKSLAIGSFTTMSCIIITPLMLHLKSNIVGFIICIGGCFGTFILWYFRHQQHVLFIIGIATVNNVYQLQWGSANSMISSFVSKNNKRLSHKYLSGLSSAWTIATFLFIAVGYILKYQTFWVYLEWMFVIFAILSCINLLLLPKTSVNKYNQLHHSKSEIDKHVSITQDFRILFSIKEYRLIIFILALGFIAWSWYYTSFGYWIQYLYDLDQAELGIAAALIEGIGNSIAVVVIAWFASTNKEDEEEEDKRYKMRLEVMMIYFALLVLLSVGGMVLINYVEMLQFMLDYKEIVYVLICGYFCGSEGVIVGALILSVTETPPSQQARSSAIVSIANSICMFIGQLTVGMVYDKGGFRWETPFLFGSMLVLMSGTIYLAHIMRERKLKDELIWINQHNDKHRRYT